MAPSPSTHGPVGGCTCSRVHRWGPCWFHLRLSTGYCMSSWAIFGSAAAGVGADSRDRPGRPGTCLVAVNRRAAALCASPAQAQFCPAGNATG